MSYYVPFPGEVPSRDYVQEIVAKVDYERAQECDQINDATFDGKLMNGEPYCRHCGKWKGSHKSALALAKGKV